MEYAIIKKLGTRKYITTRELKYKLKNGTEIVIPKGFETNLMSSPKFLEAIIPHNSNYTLEASILHDFMYNKQSNKYKITRKKADEIFKNMIRNRGLGILRANILYIMLRVCGWNYWKK